MRFMVIAAERAATIATTIQRNCLTVGQLCLRGARRQQRPGQRKRQREHGVLELDHLQHGADSPGIRVYASAFLAAALTFQRYIFSCGNPSLRQHPAHILLHQIINRSAAVIKSWHHGHDHRAGLLRPQHILQMDAAERCFTHAQNQLAFSLSADIRRAREQIVARAIGDGSQRSHRAWNDDHAIHVVAAGCDRGADIVIRQALDLFGLYSRRALRQLLRVAEPMPNSSAEQSLSRLR